MNWPAKQAVVEREGSSIVGLRDEEIHSQPLGEELGDELSLHAVPGGVEWRRKGAKPALAGRDGPDAAADPALARQPDVVEPVTRGLVQAGGRHHGERVMADSRV